MDSAQVQQIVGDEDVDCGGDVGELVTTAIVDPHLQYDDIFPALPDAPTTADTPLLTTNQSNKMRIGTSVVTQVFRMAVEERKNVDLVSPDFGGGQHSKICADITAKTGAMIEIGSAKDQSLTFLITGKNEAVSDARKEILKNFQTLVNQTVKIPKEHHRFLLGKGGQKLKDLQEVTGTKIEIPRAETNSDEIRISGPREGIEKAIHEMRIVSDERDKHGFEKLDIEKLYHPFLTGARNEKLDAIESSTGVRVNVPPSGVMRDDITIAGDREGVAKAKDIILKDYETIKSKFTTVSVEVKKSQHKYIIGPKGGTIADILQETGVSVEMPPVSSNAETITLRGPHDKLGSALTMVYDRANSCITTEIVAPPWLHKYIIGKGGANISRITKDLPKVHVTFTDKDGKITLEGPPEDVGNAEQILKNLTSELEAKLNYTELSVDHKYYKHIIGKSGSNVNRLKGETDVTISFPGGESSSIIRLEGSHAGVKVVKEEIESMVAKMENERQKDILIENRFHAGIIGQKGSGIREIRSKFNEVNISFPDVGEKKDLVCIRGPKEDVENCYNYLKKLNKELIESNFQLSVPIFKQFHKFIIGKGGANIRKIRDETGTRIELPSEGSDSDNIIITGRKANVEDARDRIQAIQSEMANIVQVDIIIQHKFHNSIIGAGGKLIQSIMQDCGGVGIKFPPVGSNSDKVSVRGPQEDVNKAKKMLLELANEKQETSFTAEVRAKPKHHRFLIGRNGTNIKKVRDETGARVVFPTDKDTDKELIVIIGRKDAVAKAKEQLEKMIKELDKNVDIEMKVDPKYHKHFVAKRGELLHEISDQYGGVTISFPRTNVSSDIVVIKGAKDCVNGAKQRILDIIQELEQQVSIDCVIPQKYHRNVMGAKGLKIQAITGEFGVNIKFPDRNMGNTNGYEGFEASGDRPPVINGYGGGNDGGGPPRCDIIQISGNKEKCEGAKEALLALVPITEDVTMPYDFHRFIIGLKGQDVRKMMEKYDVNITVPPQYEKSDIIKVSGPAANVTRAKEALQNKREELEKAQEDKKLRSYEEILEVNPRYHPKIIGKKGNIIMKLRSDHDVQIELPKRGDENQSRIRIIGYEANVGKAKDALMKLVGRLEDMIDVPVELDSRIHSRLIGQRGRTIRKIMEDFKVDIKFPSAEDEDKNKVVITGLEDDAMDCKDHLLNLEEEYMQDVDEREDMKKYMRHEETNTESKNENRQQAGFTVVGAPWSAPAGPTPDNAPNMTSTDDFPSFGETSNSSMPIIWGPRK